MVMNADFVVLVCSWNGVCNKIFNYISSGGTKNLVCSNSFLELQVWLQEKWPNRVSKKGLTQTDKSNWKELLLMQDLNGIARILFTNWGYLSAGNIYLLSETFASFCGFWSQIMLNWTHVCCILSWGRKQHVTQGFHHHCTLLGLRVSAIGHTISTLSFTIVPQWRLCIQCLLVWVTHLSIHLYCVPSCVYFWHVDSLYTWGWKHSL